MKSPKYNVVVALFVAIYICNKGNILQTDCQPLRDFLFSSPIIRELYKEEESR